MAKARSDKTPSNKSSKTTKKSSAKKSGVKKVSVKKANPTKSTTKKAGSKKTTTKAAAKKSATKKSSAKKTTAKSTASKKTAAAGKSVTKKSAKTAKSTSKKTGKSTTSKSTTTKKTTTGQSAGANATSPAQPADKKPKRVKTNLSRKQLAYFRELLLEKRAELVGDLSGMENSALRYDRSNLSTMPQHMADMGSDSYDQDLTLGLMESERELLYEIDDALQRIADGTFGICVETGKPIEEARLEVKPWAKYGIEAARSLEGRRR